LQERVLLISCSTLWKYSKLCNHFYVLTLERNLSLGDMAGDIKPINRHWCLRFCKIPLYSKAFFNSKWPQAKNIHEVLYFRFHVSAPFPSILLLIYQLIICFLLFFRFHVNFCSFSFHTFTDISINNLFSVFSGLDNPG